MRRRLWAAAVVAAAVWSGLPAGAAAPAAVYARAQTPAVSGDNADDPAIWTDPRHPGRGLVLGTLKDLGLGVYDLRGRLVQVVPPVATPPGASKPSRFNNVDVVRGFRLGGRRVDLAVVTDRGLDQVRFYRIDGSAAAPLSDVTAAGVPFVFSADLAEVGGQATAYGLTTWTDPRSGRAYAYVTRRHGLAVAELELVADGGAVTYRRTGTVTLPGAFPVPGGTWSPCEEPGEQAQSEGMAVDPAARTLYIGQEDVGLWRTRVPLGAAAPELVDRVRSFGVPAAYDPATDACVPTGPDPGVGGRHLTADVEGIEVVPRRAGDALLVVSSQGDSTFAAYDHGGRRYRGSFTVGDGPCTDGTSDTDGLAIAPRPLGPDWPGGLAVIQDGDAQPTGGTNFKLVPWPAIPAALHLPV